MFHLLPAGNPIVVPPIASAFAIRKTGTRQLQTASLVLDGYEGPNGFFKVSAMEADALQAGCESQAKHRLQPFGFNPKVQSLRVQGQPACLILPSADQLPDAKGMAALMVRYPQPVRINNQSYRFFVLWADQAHIRDVGATLRFLPTAKS